MPRRVIIDSDTAGDDTQAILFAALSDRIDLEAVAIVAGNVEFDREVENAKYTLELAGVADEVPVHEGVRSPLVKDRETAPHVHGEGGLGGNLFPDTDIPSADEHAVNYLVEAARENPDELTLVCIGPLTNVATALQIEPGLGDLLDEVWVMGGAVNTLGNDTPSAEYNFWVDPDAAKLVVTAVELTLVDWGLCMRQAVLEDDELAAVEAATEDSPYAEFFVEVTERVRAFTRETHGRDATTQPDTLAVALAAHPELVAEAEVHHVDVDEREGMTRGYSLADELGVLDRDERTTVVKAIDGARFDAMFHDMLVHGNPERSTRDGA